MKKKLMIDIDDVIVNQDGWLYLVNSFLGANYTIDDVKGYYIQDLVPNEDINSFANYFITKNVYDYGKIYKDCINVLKELSEPYDVYICSAYIYRDDVLFSAKLLKYKFEFLYKNFSFLNPSHFIFSDDKSILKFDIKIDDKLDNLIGAETKILYTAYHNKNISDEKLKKSNIVRVNNWMDIKNILLKKN